jgi:hypothetical protein
MDSAMRRSTLVLSLCLTPCLALSPITTSAAQRRSAARFLALCFISITQAGASGEHRQTNTAKENLEAEVRQAVEKYVVFNDKRQMTNDKRQMTNGE